MISLVLANMLGRELFGLMAAVQVIVGFADYFKDAGIGQAIVRRPKLEPGFLSTVFFANLVMGAAISGVIWALAVPMSHLIHEPQAISVLPVLGLSIFISSFGVVQRSLCVRTMRFDRLALSNLVNAVVYGVVAVGLAYLGWGIWAMVLGTLAGQLSSNVVLWLQTSWQPAPTFHFAYLREIWVFCAGILGSNLVNHFLNNIDRMVVQVFLGTSVLGSYAIAARLVTFPAQNLGRMLTAVLLPSFSRLQDNLELYRENFLRSCAGIAMLTCPMMVGLMAVAPILVESLFHDPEWQEAIPLIVWMGPLGIVFAISLPLHTIYVSLGRSMELMVYGILFGIISAEAYLLGSLHGVKGVAIAGTLTHTVMSYFYFAVPFRFIHLKVRRLVRVLFPYFAVSGAMGLLVWGLRDLLTQAGLDPRINLVCCVVLGAAFYGGILWRFKPPAMEDMLRFVGMRRRSASSPVEVKS
ncbi:MAG: lipopolysaccharide biosynthesis protein [Planctomycetes bacterium]|nr:lipopolysaccharide biosynthesis protein [Planctomycetota bacterium]MCB9911082.1 lipopolysaccharide biosynthesis protein [Planctomycetota bacterium]